MIEGGAALQLPGDSRWSRRQSMGTMLAALIFFGFVAGRIRFEGLDGDTLCNAAYWKILFSPRLAGATNASTPKPLQAAFVGVCAQLRPWLGNAPIRLVLVAFGALTVWLLTKASFSFGGGIAASLSLLLCLYELVPFVKGGDSNVFALPFLLGGIAIGEESADRPKGYGWSCALIALASLGRVEFIAPLGTMAAANVRRHGWRTLIWPA
ncbi:MAG: hypothetical protein ACRD16_13160, partial [Thermoanaerobaculia bacterium]